MLVSASDLRLTRNADVPAALAGGFPLVAGNGDLGDYGRLVVANLEGTLVKRHREFRLFDSQCRAPNQGETGQQANENQPHKRLADWPTSRSPSSRIATADGVVRTPSAFSIRRLAIHDRDARIGGPEVDADDLAHDKDSPSVRSKKLRRDPDPEPEGVHSIVKGFAPMCQNARRRMSSDPCMD